MMKFFLNLFLCLLMRDSKEAFFANTIKTKQTAVSMAKAKYLYNGVLYNMSKGHILQESVSYFEVPLFPCEVVITAFHTHTKRKMSKHITTIFCCVAFFLNLNKNGLPFFKWNQKGCWKMEKGARQTPYSHTSSATFNLYIVSFEA